MSRSDKPSYPEHVTTIGVEELATMIHRAVPSIKSDLIRKPDSLPPRVKMPGSRKLLWLRSDVIEWLHQCREINQTTETGR
jgi:hypothetical protein